MFLKRAGCRRGEDGGRDARVTLANRSGPCRPCAVSNTLPRLLVHHRCAANIAHSQVRKLQSSGRFGGPVQLRSTSKQVVQKGREQVPSGSSRAHLPWQLAFGEVLAEVLTSLLPCYAPPPRPGRLLSSSAGPFSDLRPCPYAGPQRACRPRVTALLSGVLPGLLPCPPHPSSRHAVSFPVSAVLRAQPSVSRKSVNCG